MAEPFSIASSAIQVAGAGLSLAKTLHAYIDAVKSAQKHIKTVAVEVKLTASVLEHLGALLKENEAEQLCTKTVITDAQDALTGCRDAFGEIDDAFKAVVKCQPDGTLSVTASARFAWPFKKGRLEALQANLERLKSTLLLMLSVLSYAKEKAMRTSSTLSLQRVQIQNLIKAKDDATARYEEMLLTLQHVDVNATSGLSNGSSASTPGAARSPPKDSSRRLPQDATAQHTAPQPAVEAQNTPFIDFRTLSVPSEPAETAGESGLPALMGQLGICASAVSNLSASISSAMAVCGAEGRVQTPRARQALHEVGQAVAHLVNPNTVRQTSGAGAVDLLGWALGIPAVSKGVRFEMSAAYDALQRSLSQPTAEQLRKQLEYEQLAKQRAQQREKNRQEQHSLPFPTPSPAEHLPVDNRNYALQGYQMQLMLLEQQNKKRLLLARQHQDNLQAEQQRQWESSLASSSPQVPPGNDPPTPMSQQQGIIDPPAQKALPSGATQPSAGRPLPAKMPLRPNPLVEQDAASSAQWQFLPPEEEPGPHGAMALPPGPNPLFEQDAELSFQWRFLPPEKEPEPPGTMALLNRPLEGRKRKGGRCKSILFDPSPKIRGISPASRKDQNPDTVAEGEYVTVEKRAVDINVFDDNVGHDERRSAWMMRSPAGEVWAPQAMLNQGIYSARRMERDRTSPLPPITRSDSSPDVLAPADNEVRDNFDFDSFLESSTASDGLAGDFDPQFSFADDDDSLGLDFGAAMTPSNAPPPASTEAQYQTDILDAEDEVDELLKRWTTVGV